jgi:hypothetical protein
VHQESANGTGIVVAVVARFVARRTLSQPGPRTMRRSRAAMMVTAFGVVMAFVEMAALVMPANRVVLTAPTHRAPRRAVEVPAVLDHSAQQSHRERDHQRTVGKQPA